MTTTKKRKKRTMSARGRASTSRPRRQGLRRTTAPASRGTGRRRWRVSSGLRAARRCRRRSARCSRRPSSRCGVFFTRTAARLPTNGRPNWQVRLYVLDAFGLRPADGGGTSDPYLSVTLGGRLGTCQMEPPLRHFRLHLPALAACRHHGGRPRGAREARDGARRRVLPTLRAAQPASGHLGAARLSLRLRRLRRRRPHRLDHHRPRVTRLRAGLV